MKVGDLVRNKRLTFTSKWSIIVSNEVTPIVRMKRERDKLHDC